ncbi:MAG: hypothetical protein SFY67_11930 [Candidatus Melainabacteria bacterium]|nr:hypothetical protein [Candidatus Melainabacteria bacterium]
MEHKHHKNARILIVTCLITTLSGCGLPRISKATNDFDKGVQSAGASITQFYKNLNDYRRDVYVEQLQLDPKRTIDRTDVNDKPTPWIKWLSEDAIKSRVLAIEGLTAYTSGLAALANSDAPERTEKSIVAIGAKVKSISNNLNSLQPGQNSVAIPDYATPIAGIASIVGKYWVQGKKEDSLRKCIDEGGEDVKKVLNYLEKDLADIHKYLYKTDASYNLALMENYYNNNYVSDDPQKIKELIANDKRTAFLKKSAESAKKLAYIDTANPVELVGKMRKVHDKLLLCVHPTKEHPYPLDELLGEMQLFLAEANRIAEAVEQLKELSEKKGDK